MKKVQSAKCKVQSLLSAKNAGLKFLFLISYFLLLTSYFAFASSGGAGEHSVLNAYLWPVINFLVLIFLMIFLLKKMDIKGFFRKRTELIEQTLREAREAKELAQKALAEVQDRLAVKDSEIDEIISSAKQSGAKEKAHLIEEGEKIKGKILEQAKTNIDYEVKKAKEAIKKEAVEIAMELAEKKLKEKLTREEQLKLLEESLSKIEDRN